MSIFINIHATKLLIKIFAQPYFHSFKFFENTVIEKSFVFLEDLPRKILNPTLNSACVAPNSQVTNCRKLKISIFGFHNGNIIKVKCY